jgi:hypothetical protein
MNDGFRPGFRACDRKRRVLGVRGVRYFAARAPAAMITKSAKPIIAHQAMLSVSSCDLRTSHMTQTPFRRLLELRRARVCLDDYANGACLAMRGSTPNGA